MAFYKYFYDLASSTSYTTHTVGSFDNNSTTGGGNFRWVSNTSNVGIADIAGIRIKPTGSTVGYWLRDFTGPMNLGWFGCQNTDSTPSTFSQLGVSQTTLDSRYGTSFATTSDCYDTTAIRYAFNLMNTIGYQSLVFEPKKYWLNRECILPTSISTTPTNIGQFVIDGNGATILKAGSNVFDYFSRIPSSQTEASTTYINNSFVIKNFNANGTGGIWQNSGYSFLFLGATTNSVIENINLTNFDLGLRLEYCVNANVKNINTYNIKTESVGIRNGSWTSAVPTNSGSDNSTVEKLVVTDTLSQPICLHIASDNVTTNQVNIQGAGNPCIGIFVDSISNISTCRIMNTVLNVVFASGSPSADYGAGVLVSEATDSGGRFVIDGILAKQATVLAGATSTTNQPDVYLANVGTWPAGSTLASTGDSTWDLYNVRFGSSISTAADVIDPGNNLWEIYGAAAIPLIGNVRYTSPIVP